MAQNGRDEGNRGGADPVDRSAPLIQRALTTKASSAQRVDPVCCLLHRRCLVEFYENEHNSNEKSKNQNKSKRLTGELGPKSTLV